MKFKTTCEMDENDIKQAIAEWIRNNHGLEVDHISFYSSCEYDGSTTATLVIKEG